MSEFGQRLREERKRMKLNQTSFAKFGQVGLNAQSDYETGVRYPNAEYLMGIAACGADVQYILTSVRSQSVWPEGQGIPNYPEITPRMLIDTLSKIEQTIIEQKIEISYGKINILLLFVCKELVERQRLQPDSSPNLSSLSSFQSMLDLARAESKG